MAKTPTSNNDCPVLLQALAGRCGGFPPGDTPEEAVHQFGQQGLSLRAKEIGVDWAGRLVTNPEVAARCVQEYEEITAERARRRAERQRRRDQEWAYRWAGDRDELDKRAEAVGFETFAALSDLAHSYGYTAVGYLEKLEFEALPVEEQQRILAEQAKASAHLRAQLEAASRDTVNTPRR